MKITINNHIMFQTHYEFALSANIAPSEECWVICLRMVLSIMGGIPLEKIESTMTSEDFLNKMKYDSWDNQEIVFQLEDRLSIFFSSEQINCFPALFCTPFDIGTENIGEWVHKVIYDWLPNTDYANLRW
jgi:acyl carrier protein